MIAEADCHRVQGAESWQQEFLLDRLSASTCVFVGASMTDVNVLRFLRLARETGAEQRHLALLPEAQTSAATTLRWTRCCETR